MDEKERDKRHRIIVGIQANAHAIVQTIEKHHEAMIEKDVGKLREQRRSPPYRVAEGHDEEAQIEAHLNAITADLAELRAYTLEMSR